MKTTALQYALPTELIAQEPLTERDESRLLVVDRATGQISHQRFSDLPQLLRCDDLLIRNRSRVLHARVHGARRSGGRAEVLFLEPLDRSRWKALVKPRRRLEVGLTLKLGDLHVEVASVEEDHVVLEMPEGTEVESLCRQYGEPPLPPYIRRPVTPADSQRYQTVFAHELGSVAAPTAGLHFTESTFRALSDRGIAVADVLLHVGLGTFRPVRSALVEDHKIHSERYQMPMATFDLVTAARSQGQRVVAVGTTSVRVLESIWAAQAPKSALQGRTELFITPGFQFQAVDALVTNFHAPGSTLLALVMALAGEDLMRHAYETAVTKRYRFLSYGDAMLIQ